MNNLLLVLESFGPYVIGASVTLVFEFLTGFIREFFSERARVAKHRRDVARQVLQICNEAATSNYRSVPRDREHINSVIVDLSGVDTRMAGKMNAFFKQWKSSSELDGFTSHEELTKIRKELSAWATEIRNGRG